MAAIRADRLNDCFSHDRDRLTHDAALALICGHGLPAVGRERVPLGRSAGRYGAADIVAPRAVPGHDNAAVDGYAVRHGDLNGHGESVLAVVERIAAGDQRSLLLGAGEAARIFTGAPVPIGADTIVMQEDTRPAGQDRVVLPAGLRKGANLRPVGEDLAPGAGVLRAGQRLRPADIAALASIGLADVEVFAQLRVGVLSSGDEIARPGAPLPPGGVYDANGAFLRALMAGLPVEAVDLGIVPDRAEDVRARLAAAAASCDLVLTTGGASRGEEDHFVRLLAGEGALHAWQIAVKPGRPLGFATFAGTRVLMLPGNPVAVMVCFLLYGLPLLARLGGGEVRAPRRYQLPAGFAIAGKKPDRREFLRGMLEERQGRLIVDKYPRDGSGLISSLRAADGLIEIPEPVTRLAKGDMVAFIPFGEFGLPG